WRLLGSAQYHLDRFEEAASAYRQSIAIQPNGLAYASLGAVLYHCGEHREAIEALERAAALLPADAKAWGNLGSACHWIPGNETRAREALQGAVGLMREHLALDPADGEGWSWLASWQSNLGRHPEALQAARRALELWPTNVDVLLEAGQAYFLAGNREEALH